MNAAATQDVRAIDTVPLLRSLLHGSQAPNQQTAQMLSLLVAWRQQGGSRLDRDLDGKIDDPGAAIMDAAWPRIADAFMRPKLGPQLDELNSLFSRLNSRREASTTAGTSTSTATSASCWDAGRAAAQPELLRWRRSGPVPQAIRTAFQAAAVGADR